MQEEHFTPKGTWALGLIYIVILILIWGSVYYFLLSQGPTIP